MSDRATLEPLSDDEPSELGRWAAIAIIAVAATRMLVSIQSQVRFATDPAINAEPFAALGPVGSVVLDIVLLIACAAAFVAEARRGRGVRGWLVGCAAVPAVAVLFHGVGDAAALFRGATWLAAAMACVATAHLARTRALRSLLVAGVIAVSAPLALRGAEQVLVDHAATVKHFEQTRDAFFAERGWSPDGAAAQGFERRLRQVEASAWFGLANLFSSVMAFGALTCIGLAVAPSASRRGRVPIALMVGPLVLALGCAALVAVNGSKGAIVAGVLGAAVGAVAWLRPAWTAWCAIGVVAVAGVAAVGRGLLPEDFLNERSLLFRWHYLSGAAAMLPHSLPFGIGPDSFQSAYMLFKPARSPEDVVSAHSMTMDWLVMLGPLSLAWVALVLRGLGGRPRSADAQDQSALDVRRVIAAAFIVAALSLAVQAYAEQSFSDVRWLLVRLGSAAIFAVALVVVALRADRSDDRGVRAALAAGVVAVFAQAQIEMILFQPGSVVWALVALGAYMGPTLDIPAVAATRRAAWIGCGLAAMMALAIAGIGLVPQVRQDRMLDQAAALVEGIAEVRAEWPMALQELAAGKPGLALGRIVDIVGADGGVELQATLKQAIGASGDPAARAAQVATVLRRFDANQRARAADVLQAADAEYPENRTALDAAIKQLAAAGRRTIGARRSEIVEPMLHQLAVQLAARGAEQSRSPFSGALFHARLADLLLEQARVSQDERTLDLARQAVEAALERQPRSPRLCLDLGDVLAASGNAEAAAIAYERALAIDDDLELDPVAQFPDRDRTEIEERLAIVRRARDGGEALPKGWPLARQATNVTTPVERR